MASFEATASILSFHYSSSSTPKYPSYLKPSTFIKLNISNSTPTLSLKFPIHPLNGQIQKQKIEIFSTLQEIEVEEDTEKTQLGNQKRKLYVVNLPWSLSVLDIKELFGQCGTVVDVEIIKQKDGKSRGFAFVTMDSAEEAQAVVDKFDSFEVSGRTIRIEFAKRFKRPPPPPPPSGPRAGETRHKLYVSNLAWKARSNHLRELFAASSNPVSVRVVFDSPSGRSSGYGFVSFATREEADAAISEFDGKELMGRPLRLKLSEKNIDESGNEIQEVSSEQPESS